MNVGKLSFARLLLISCLKLLPHSLHRNNGTYLYKISPFTVGECAHAVFNFFLYFFLCFFCFHIFFGLIVKQIFEEKGKFIFIFLQIP